METGKVVEIIGAVIDVQFPRESMPNIFDALLIEDGDLTLEAVSYTHLTLPTNREV